MNLCGGNCCYINEQSTLHFIIIVIVIIIIAAAVVDITMDVIQPTISIIVITTTPLVLYFLYSTVKVSRNVLFS